MNRFPSSLVLLALALAACGGEKPSAAPPATQSGAPAPAPTGRVIEIKAISEGAENYFEPKDIKARRGDRIKLVLVSGVHNLAWPAGKNPAGAELPAATEMLQLPGQTVEISIGMPPGKYNFVCVPHEALGMVGTLEVEDDEDED